MLALHFTKNPERFPNFIRFQYNAYVSIYHKLCIRLSYYQQPYRKLHMYI